MNSFSHFLAEIMGNRSGAMGPGEALLAIAVAYLGGILSSLTPCVYPMIPITVSVVGGLPHSKAAEGKRPSWRTIVFRGMAYVLGMTMIYSFLGVAAGLTGRVFGTLTNSSGWYAGLGIVMTFAALLMLDIFHFDPALWWSHFKLRFMKGGHKPHHHPTADESAEATWIAAFLLGASSGFIAAPCTTPVLSAILAYIAKTQSIGLGLALMIAFSFGLGTLLLVIASFTGALQILPKSGNWMRFVKIASGLILLGFAEYLFFEAGRRGGYL